MPSNPRPIIILGPTAGGKSELAVALATGPAGPAQIINADSMQVYRHLDAGTAKPGPALRARVPHHLIDIVEPTERFTVADWLARADALIAAMQAQGIRPVIVGGTNLYIKALLEGMFPGPAMDEEFRAGLSGQSGPQLHAQLVTVDPAAAARIHPNDHKKLVRALEVFHTTGRPISAQQTQWDQRPRGTGLPPGVLAPISAQQSQLDQQPELAPGGYRHNPLLIGLDWPTEALNRRINARVKLMFEPQDPGTPGTPGTESLPDEVRRLETAGLLGPQARQALGYKQVLEHLHSQVSLEEAFERTKILTRRFAKTQRTWLRRYRQVHWLPAAAMTPEQLARAATDIAMADE